ncbi:MAG: response regulator transcription factor [Aquiluna sp.]|nr:response regulator transcription factor [Aquiluna sp.]MCF8545499.1 response regulator transcription factor [Aquiluna sp.]
MAKPDPKTYRHVLVVENEPLMRDLFAKAVESAGFVVTTAANAADAKRAMKSVDPDCVVVDIELGPGPNGFELVESLKPTTPSIGIVYLTNLPDPRFGNKDPKQVKNNQAYLRKGAIQTGQELVDAIEAVLKDKVTKEFRHDLASNRPFAALSKRQVETLQMLSEGKTNQQIASIRGTTVRAVESMLTRIFELIGIDPKTGNPRVEAAAKYFLLREQD